MSKTWLETINDVNERFRQDINLDVLPSRAPGNAVITCMDPRVNLNAIGIPDFEEDGSLDSNTRIIRTLGARAEERSLLVGVMLAGIKEIAVLMHTDCGCCLAHKNIDTLLERLDNRLDEHELAALRTKFGEPFKDKLLKYLKTFQDPFEAIKEEVKHIKQLPFIPKDVRVHGLVYTLETGKVEVVVNGYA